MTLEPLTFSIRFIVKRTNRRAFIPYMCSVLGENEYYAHFNNLEVPWPMFIRYQVAHHAKNSLILTML